MNPRYIKRDMKKEMFRENIERRVAFLMFHVSSQFWNSYIMVTIYKLFAYSYTVKKE